MSKVELNSKALGEMFRLGLRLALIIMIVLAIWNHMGSIPRWATWLPRLEAETVAYLCGAWWLITGGKP